jgi:hypothetical protein
MAKAPMPICTTAPSSTERISLAILVSISLPLPPALPDAARRKHSRMGKWEAPMRTRLGHVVELLTPPSLEMAASA